ncbi:hypothetical protein GCM10027456_00050 [Kineosporia babensis]
MESTEWDTAWLSTLMIHLRRNGILVHEARIVQSGVVSICFEPHLTQAEILEGLLLSWPDIATVERVDDRMLRASRKRAR